MQQWNLILLLSFVIWGCSSQEKNQLPEQFQQLDHLTVYSESEPEKQISFKKDAVFGSSKEVLIGKIGDLAVDSTGRVFIADVQNQTINVFLPDGQYQTQLGREGKGPSEFGYIKSLQIHMNLLYAYDSKQLTVSAFALDTLAGDKTIVLARNRKKYRSLTKAYPGVHELYVRNNGTYLAKFISHGTNPTKRWQNKEMKALLYPLDRTGKVASDKLIEYKEEIRTYHKGSIRGLLPIEPFFGKAFTVLSSDNTIHQAGPEYFLIKEYSSEGDYQQAFYYPIKKIPLTQESAVEAGVHDYYIRNMKNMDLPPNWPVLTDMRIDDQDRLWIAATVEDMNIHQWWVLEESGELLTRFTLPRNKQIEEIKNGYFYTRETEEETGIQQIVRYRFEMN